MTTEKKFAEMTDLDWLKHELERTVYRANQVRNTLTEKISLSLSSAEYELRWLGGCYEKIVLGKFAEEALAFLKTEKATPEQIEQHFRDEFARWYPERSTSPFSNACNDERHAALKEMIKIFARYHEKE
jgi:hypothetical protein